MSAGWVDGPRGFKRWTIKWKIRCLQLWCDFVGAFHSSTTLEWIKPCTGEFRVIYSCLTVEVWILFWKAYCLKYITKTYNNEHVLLDYINWEASKSVHYHLNILVGISGWFSRHLQFEIQRVTAVLNGKNIIEIRHVSFAQETSLSLTSLRFNCQYRTMLDCILH